MIIQCPKCSRDLELKEEMLDKRIRCPLCQEIFTVTGSAPRQAEAERVIADINPPPLPPAHSPPVSQPSPPTELDEDRPRPRRRRNDRYDDRDDYRDDYDYRYRSRAGMTPDRGSMVLVFGILSLVICAPILGPIAWIMGSNDLTEMREGRMDPIGESNTRAGMICGIIGTVLGIISVLGVSCWFLFVLRMARAFP